MNIWIYLLSISLSAKIGLYCAGLIWLFLGCMMFFGEKVGERRALLFLCFGLVLFSLATLVPLPDSLKESKKVHKTLCEDMP